MYRHSKYTGPCVRRVKLNAHILPECFRDLWNKRWIIWPLVIQQLNPDGTKMELLQSWLFLVSWPLTFCFLKVNATSKYATLAQGLFRAKDTWNTTGSKKGILIPLLLPGKRVLKCPPYTRRENTHDKEKILRCPKLNYKLAEDRKKTQGRLNQLKTSRGQQQKTAYFPECILKFWIEFQMVVSEVI